MITQALQHVESCLLNGGKIVQHTGAGCHTPLEEHGSNHSRVMLPPIHLFREAWKCHNLLHSGIFNILRVSHNFCLRRLRTSTNAGSAELMVQFSPEVAAL